MALKFLVSPSPHIRTKETVEQVMKDVIFALFPAMIAAVYFFGIKALFIISLAVVSALATEVVTGKLLKKETTVTDGSAIITGILFAFCISPALLWWQVMIGSFVAVFFGKMIFGGLGHNIFNPALIGRVFLMASWPAVMTTWILPDGNAGATPLGILKNRGYDALLLSFDGDRIKMYIDLFIGKIGGSIGETSAFALLLGGAYLLYKKQITWHIPVMYIGTVFLLSLVFGQDPLLHILSGGLFLGAFFMATDMVTTPLTRKGRMIFGVGAGILTVWIRLKGGYPEGVCYSILIMNAVTPLINRYTKPKVFGEA